MSYPSASLTKNDKKANIFIWAVSAVVFVAVVILHELKIEVDLGFDKHIFAHLNAIINGTVALLLIFGLFLVKSKKFMAHKRVMNLSIILSVLFLLSYIAHHLFAGNTVYGDSNFDGQLSDLERIEIGNSLLTYRLILISHILLAGLSLPFILYSAYRASVAEFGKHKKLVRYVYPVWLYVAVTGVVVYFMIEPYYS
tara:strand:- start:185 stop:775 length:591 start_codon:yes stop_codon:yes gene_type:complete